MAIATKAGQVDLARLYEPQPKQILFHQSTAQNRLMVGGSGGGKSIALLWEAIKLVYQYPGIQCLLLRRSFPDLEKGLIADLRATIPQELYHWDDSDHIASFKVRAGAPPSKVFFGHAKDDKESSLARQFLSSAFPFIGIDELGQFSYWTWQFLSSRNRINPGCQADASGRMPIPGMAGATNPTGSGWGWVKGLWLDLKSPPEAGDLPINPDDYFHVHSTILDNRALMERDPGYIEKLKKLPPDLRKKFLEGDVNLLSGQYYSNFSPQKHVIDLQADPGRIEWQPWQPAWIGVDWGLAHHAVAHWWTRALLRTEDGTRRMVTVCYRELIIRECSINKFAKFMGEMCDGWCHGGSPNAEKKAIGGVYISHELFNRKSDPSPDQTIAAELGRALKTAGLPWPQRASGSASSGERRTGAVMIYEDIEAGDLVFLATCRQTVRAIPLLARDADDLDDVAKTATMEDDIFDALKHGVLSVRRDKRQPREDWALGQAKGITDPLQRWFFLRAQKGGISSQGRPFAQEVVPHWQRGT